MIVVYYTYPISLVLLVVGAIVYYLKKERKKLERIAYPEIEVWALFGIMALGIAFVYLVSAMVYGTWQPWVTYYIYEGPPIIETIPPMPIQWNHLVITLLLLPIIVYVFILTWGKKTKYQQ